jgi:hypothetical protein
MVLMESRSTHTGTNERKPKERKEQKHQRKGAGKCACAKGIGRIGYAGMMAVSTCEHYRSITQISPQNHSFVPPQNPSFAKNCSWGGSGAWRCGERGCGGARCGRHPRLLKFCHSHLPPIFIGGRNDLGHGRGRDVNGRGRNYWDRIIFFVARGCGRRIIIFVARGCGRWLSHG